MKNKKGFTLVELLAVIAILSVVLLIITPSVFSNTKKSKEKAYMEQVSILEETAERWSIKNANQLDELKPYYLEIYTLVDEKYINQSDIIDPRDKTRMAGCIVITFNSKNNQYTFKYNENTCNTLKNT